MIRETGLRYGLYAGGSLVAYGLIYRVVDISPSSALKWLFYLFLVTACGVAQQKYSVAAQRISFAGKLAVGSLTAVLGSAIYATYVFLYNRLVDDSLIQQILADGRRSIAARGGASEEMAQSLASLEWLARPAPFAAMIFLQMVVFGVLASLIGAAVIRRPTPNLAPGESPARPSESVRSSL